MALISKHIELQDGFLTNTPLREPRPRRLPWEYFLFVWHVRKFQAKIKGKVRRWTVRKRGFITLSAPTKKEIDQELIRFIKRRDVRLLPPKEE